MDNIWVLPELLHDKLMKSAKLRKYFKHIPRDCYAAMMSEVVCNIGSKQNLSNELRHRIETKHAQLRITSEHYDIFVGLFMDTVREIGVNSSDMTYIEERLTDMIHIFQFDEDDVRERTIWKINDIIEDLESYTDNDHHTKYDEAIRDLMKTAEKIKQTMTRKSSDMGSRNCSGSYAIHTPSPKEQQQGTESNILNSAPDWLC